MKRVVVTGLGALTPIGNNVDDFWQSLLTGVNGTNPLQNLTHQNSKQHLLANSKALTH